VGFDNLDGHLREDLWLPPIILRFFKYCAKIVRKTGLEQPEVSARSVVMRGIV
jgi:hypothetical protein